VQTVKKYNNHLNQAINLEKISQHLSDLYQNRISELTTEQQLALNDIDKKLTMAKQAAEQHCRKKNTGKMPWTLVVTQAIYRILYWKGVRKCQERGHICNMVLQKQAQAVAEVYSLQHVELEPMVIKSKIRTAVQEYLVVKKQADQRDTWMAQIIKAQAESKNMKQSRLWKQL